MRHCRVDHLTRLLIAARDGDRGALERFVAETQADVWRLCRYLGDAAVRRRPRAGDLRTSHRLACIATAPTDPAHGWLLTIARRTCVDHTRRAGRRRRIDRAALEKRAQDRSTARWPAGPVRAGGPSIDVLEHLDADRRSRIRGDPGARDCTTTRPPRCSVARSGRSGRGLHGPASTWSTMIHEPGDDADGDRPMPTPDGWAPGTRAPDGRVTARDRSGPGTARGQRTRTGDDTLVNSVRISARGSTALAGRHHAEDGSRRHVVHGRGGPAACAVTDAPRPMAAEPAGGRRERRAGCRASSGCAGCHGQDFEGGAGPAMDRPRRLRGRCWTMAPPSWPTTAYLTRAIADPTAELVAGYSSRCRPTVCPTPRSPTSSPSSRPSTR